ncbi:lysophospholipid acyltransferase family protein [Hydrogenimonas cancrithermarum]|uniref:1-acyl-sn-glycerol-3-phosphate acyltransferase n=1 Tax=Hydrogenimonas cancrithermarum TaxID=2993563 RepID=A0ABM8FIH7_9BACT|nr:lysophospholipid acyltransferase family protein [Hydrogenimonas cancrithermarum]BDY12071.1 1-acyl-sn-glycerol-3-phosphate acyltransferase [Hydrogenimonas cancrithermarum]
MKIFARIRFYYSALVISLIVSVMIKLLYLFPKYKSQILHYGNKTMLALMFAKVETVGKPDERAQLYLINHQGIVDIITLEAILNKNLNWVAKKELFEVPWFGLLLKNAEMIAVDREDKRGLIKLMKDIKHSIEDLHRPVAIFPEGTRAKGQKLLPFKEGAKFVAEKFGLIVQPVVIVGSKRVVNEHEKTSIGGDLKVIFLPSIDVKNAPENWYDKLREDMQRRIDQELETHTISR